MINSNLLSLLGIKRGMVMARLAVGRRIACRRMVDDDDEMWSSFLVKKRETHLQVHRRLKGCPFVCPSKNMESIVILQKSEEVKEDIIHPSSVLDQKEKKKGRRSMMTNLLAWGKEMETRGRETKRAA